MIIYLKSANLERVQSTENPLFEVDESSNSADRMYLMRLNIASFSFFFYFFSFFFILIVDPFVYSFVYFGFNDKTTQSNL